MAKYWETNMIAENDPVSGVYIPGLLDAERDAMARMVYMDQGVEPGITQVPLDHVMVDIETMSLHRHKALILSVGMVEFTPVTANAPIFGTRKLLVIPVIPQILLGRRVDVDTQEFWRKQTPAARKHWEDPDPVTLRSAETAISEIRSFCAGRGRVWANGTQFDLSNLDGLAEDIGDTKPLWHYQAPRDMRTYGRETSITRQVPIGDALDIPGVAHDPIFDCISQAWVVWSHWQG